MSDFRTPREKAGEHARQGKTVPRTPRSPILIAGPAGVAVLSPLLALAGCVPTP